MKRSKRILASSLKLLNSSSLLSPSSTTRPFHYHPTIPFSTTSPYSSPFSLLQTQPSYYNLLNTHQKLHFSTKPSPIVELILSNEWSQEVVQQLEKSDQIPTHAAVVYVLRKLDKTPQKAYAFFNWVSTKTGFNPSFTVYSLMLRILGKKEYMKDFWVFIKKMTDEGFDLEKETYVILKTTFEQAKMMNEVTALDAFYDKMIQESATAGIVEGVVNMIVKSDWDAEVEKKLGEVGLTEKLILSVLKELTRCPLKALQFFRWVGENTGYEHNALSYNALARVLGQEQSIVEFWKVIEEMKSAGHDMDLDTFIKVSRTFQKYQMMKDSVELYEFIMDGPYKPSVLECSTLLRKISATGTPDLSLVFRVVKKFEATGISLSKVIYDVIHKSFTSVGRFEEAEKILEAMRNSGHELDNITYSQVVFGLCKAGRLQEACDMLDEMEAQGCVPDRKTWIVLIQGHCDAGEVDGAQKCLTKMLEKNFDAGADLLSVLVNGLCSKKRVESAYTLVIWMVDKLNLKPWQATCKDLIPKLLAEGKLKEALNLLCLMKEQKYPPVVEPFVDYISKFGTVEDAAAFLKTLNIKKNQSITAYLHLFQSLFREGREHDAQALLYKCPQHIRSNGDILRLFPSSKQGNA